MTVRQLLQNLDSHEIGEWIAFFKLEDKKQPDKVMATDEKIKAFFLSRRKVKS